MEPAPKEENPRERFVAAMRKIVSVPKAELQRREIAYQQARKNKHRKRHR
jgi:hypothetical protein